MGEMMKKRRLNIYVYLLIIFSLICTNSRDALSSLYEFVRQIGSFGTGDGQFYYPTYVALDTEGNIYIVDPDAETCRIQKFTSDGTYITKWGSYGTGDGQFRFPHGIVIDRSNYVYVADTQNSRIQKFTSNGAFVTKWGTTGSGDGQFSNPTGISVDSDGNICVLDASSARIQKFTSGGTFITKWVAGSTNDHAMAIDSSGNIYVTDNFTVRKYNSSGIFVTEWGSEGPGNGEFQGAYGVAIDLLGNVHVTDYFNRRIQEFTSDGGFIDKWGTYGTGDYEFGGPQGIAFDPLGNLYVADRANHRIQVFASVPEPAIRVISPNGGEELFVGEVYEIIWKSEGEIESVKIEFSTDKYSGWIEIVANTDNDGFYSWEVPCNISDEILLKISDVEGESSDVSDEVFSIEDQDSDSDGVPDCVEDAGPNGGDGNEDLIPDSQQPNVTSFETYDGQSYVTLESFGGTTITSCQAVSNPSPGDSPADIDFQYGFFSFTINGVAPRSATTVVLYYTGNTIDTYYKYGPTPNNHTDHWYQFMDDGNTGADIDGNQITLNFVNGDRGDDDLDSDNSIIVDVGGPGVNNPQPQSSSNGGGGGGGCFIGTADNSLQW
jgi:streptogramin lyase